MGGIVHVCFEARHKVFFMKEIYHDNVCYLVGDTLVRVYCKDTPIVVVTRQFRMNDPFGRLTQCKGQYVSKEYYGDSTFIPGEL